MGEEIIYITYKEDREQSTKITNEDIERIKRLSERWER